MTLAAWAIAAVMGVALATSSVGAKCDVGAKQAPGERHGGASATARIHITKSQHRLEVIDNDAVVRTFGVSIGPGGAGVKRQEGDKVTPVGRYHVVSRVRSTYHVFLRLDYPNADDRARFKHLQATGALPKDATIGGDVGIHGAPPQAVWKATHKEVDWTLGCVALDDAEVDELAQLVKDGAIVDIDD
jgi:murein L,D-transpeptidase YafK